MKRVTAVRSLAFSLLVAAAGCGSDGPTGSVPAGASLAVSVTGLAPLDATTGGRYEAWVVDRGGVSHSLGNVDPRAGASLSFSNPVADPATFVITYEPRGDTDPAPSPHRLLAGALQGGRARLSVEGAITASDLPLRDRPGQFTMFSPSDNFRNGYPSNEESGIWLFNMAPRETQQGDMWVRLTQLQPGWVYEGWMVRDIDAPNAVWLSYGKFLPDASGTINTRDDTGWGEFSGVTDFLKGEEEFPGDDWISNPLGYQVPGGLTLPLNLREKSAAGAGRWTHLITIEPSSDRGEPVTTPVPFTVRPYRDPFGDGAPGAPRTITFRADGVPRGEVTIR